MKPLFVDTSAWFAVVARRDRDHPACQQFLMRNRRPLLTSDYIVDETATLIQARIDHSTAVRFLDRIQASRLVQVLYLESRYIDEALALFRKRPDKGWSVTDCTSFVTMQLKQIDTAFALDDHFRQAGFQVLP